MRPISTEFIKEERSNDDSTLLGETTKRVTIESADLPVKDGPDVVNLSVDNLESNTCLTVVGASAEHRLESNENQFADEVRQTDDLPRFPDIAERLREDTYSFLLRPIPLIGQIVGLFVIAALISTLFANHSALVSVIGPKFIAIPFVLVMLAATVGAVKFHLTAFVEFFAGLSYPIVNVLGFAREFPLIAIGDVFQSRNRYDLSASCYGKAIKIAGRFSVITDQVSLMREYLECLASAGYIDEAHRFAVQWMKHAAALAQMSQSGTIRDYHAQTLWSVGRFHELLGDDYTAIEIWRQAYNMGKDAPLHTTAAGCAYLCGAEALAAQGRHEESIALFDAALQCLLYSQRFGSSAVSTGYLKRAVSLAVLGQHSKSASSLNKGVGKSSLDLSTIARVREAIARARVLDAAGQSEQADNELQTCNARFKIISDTTLGRRLESERQRLKNGEVLLVSPNATKALPTGRPNSGPQTTEFLVDSERGVHSAKLLFKGEFADTRRAFVAMVAGLLLTTQHQSAGIYAFAGVTFVFMLIRTSIRSGRAEQAIASGCSQRTIIRLGESGNASIALAGEERYPIIFSNRSLFDSLKKICGRESFDCTVFFDSSNEPRAVQVLGYCSALSKDAWR